ncbi:MAG: bifunctional pyr operon transcriptional regulator/uracil phosphoribosyltransferase PyrR [Rhodothermales bacterium]|nr:bifunctional pyr operon transcriptional regulator/uracil phosphoribosyltransferase PyrR [Rhodothermales bacterium]
MRTRIMTSAHVRRTLDRLAHEIVERNRGAGNLVIMGILKSGAEVAGAVVDFIGRIESVEPPCVDLDVTPFRDDRESGEGEAVDLPDLTDRDVVLVDDVLFTGRTVRAALDALVRAGRPRSIQLLVLVDRGHREYPIQPDYVGRVLPTKHEERVEVLLEDGGMAVDVVE